MRNFTKQRKLAVVGVIVALVAAGGAFAFWTGGGTGTGTATVASGGTVVLTGTVGPGISPGGSATVTFTAANTTSSPASVSSVSLTSITSVPVGCVTAPFGDFAMITVTEPTVVIGAHTSGVALPNAGTLTYANTAVNQDVCKDAVLTLNLASL